MLARPLLAFLALHPEVPPPHAVLHSVGTVPRVQAGPPPRVSVSRLSAGFAMRWATSGGPVPTLVVALPRTHLEQRPTGSVHVFVLRCARPQPRQQ